MSLILWLIYFVTTVMGYVGMKLASDAQVDRDRFSLDPFLCPWGIAAMLAWTISGLVWPWILARQSLVWANAFSSLRVIFIVLAAVVCLGESISSRHIVGAVLITIGICLSK